LTVAIVGERRCGKTSLTEALRRCDLAARGTPAGPPDPLAVAATAAADGDDASVAAVGWCQLNVIDLSSGGHLDAYSRALEVDAFLLTLDVTSLHGAGAAHHNGGTPSLASRQAARLHMWLQALYEVTIHHSVYSYLPYPLYHASSLGDFTQFTIIYGYNLIIYSRVEWHHCRK